MTLGNRLKEAREKKRFTQIEVAKKLGISNGTLSGYERDYRDPDTDTLDKLASLYEVTVDYLLGRTDDKTRTLRPHTRKMIDLLDQDTPDEEIFEAFSERFMVGGIPMNKDEALWFIDFLRARRARQKREDRPSDVSTP